MIPFIKNKVAKPSGVITSLRKPDEDQHSEDTSGLEVAMEDLSRAHEIKDYKGMAKAIKAAFEILDSMPHEEGPHTNE